LHDRTVQEDPVSASLLDAAQHQPPLERHVTDGQIHDLADGLGEPGFVDHSAFVGLGAIVGVAAVTFTAGTRAPTGR
jgi:hypothetical protein